MALRLLYQLERQKRLKNEIYKGKNDEWHLTVTEKKNTTKQYLWSGYRQPSRKR